MSRGGKKGGSARGGRAKVQSVAIFLRMIKSRIAIIFQEEKEESEGEEEEGSDQELSTHEKLSAAGKKGAATRWARAKQGEGGNKRTKEVAASTVFKIFL